jgi:hypothetical protein
MTGNRYDVMRGAWAIAFVVALGHGQQSAPFFTQGASRDEIRKVAGPPESSFSMDSAYTPGSKIDVDVYLRETPTNAYRVQVWYRLDTSASRLRPTPRAAELKIEIDRPASATTILKDFPEAAEICKAGCDLYGVPDVVGNYVLAYPSKPTPAQLEMGKRVATGFAPRETTAEWCLAVRLKLDSSGTDWSGKVSSLEVSGASLQNLDLANLTETKAARIGTWAPPRQEEAKP